MHSPFNPFGGRSLNANVAAAAVMVGVILLVILVIISSTVSTISLNLAVTPQVAPRGTTVTFVVMAQQGDKALSGATVTLSVVGPGISESGSAVTDANGVALIPITIPSTGDGQVSVTGTATLDLQGRTASASTTLIVVPAPS